MARVGVWRVGPSHLRVLVHGLWPANGVLVIAFVWVQPMACRGVCVRAVQPMAGVLDVLARARTHWFSLLRVLVVGEPYQCGPCIVVADGQLG